MRREDVSPSKRVKIIVLNETMGMPIDHDYLRFRRNGVVGTILSTLPDSKNEVWLMRHEGSEEIAAYSYDEMMPA